MLGERHHSDPGSRPGTGGPDYLFPPSPTDLAALETGLEPSESGDAPELWNMPRLLHRQES